MARVSKITLSQPKIADYLTNTGRSVYSLKELSDLIIKKRYEWNLPATASPEKIIEKLTENLFFNHRTFEFTNGAKHETYIYGNPSIYEVAVSVRPKSYISHYPAVYLHELTTQVPKTIYTTQEQSLKVNRGYQLEQEAIDGAFSSPQRRSNLVTEYEDYIIILLSGMHTGRSGVLLSTRYKNSFSYTNLERTLIDITVRPNYAGGAFTVLDAYRKALEKDVISSVKLITTYENIGYVYPYNQAIGFYLEKAGYKGKMLDMLRKKPLQYKFYLDYGIEDKNYDKNWKIFYPKGM